MNTPQHNNFPGGSRRRGRRGRGRGGDRGGGGGAPSHISHAQLQRIWQVTGTRPQDSACLRCWQNSSLEHRHDWRNCRSRCGFCNRNIHFGVACRHWGSEFGNSWWRERVGVIRYQALRPVSNQTLQPEHSQAQSAGVLQVSNGGRQFRLEWSNSQNGWHFSGTSNHRETVWINGNRVVIDPDAAGYFSFNSAPNNAGT